MFENGPAGGKFNGRTEISETIVAKSPRSAGRSR
jgi:hypothetical protein